jgi:hypothetical protein
MRWTGHVASPHSVLVERLEERRPLGRSSFRWDDNIKTSLQKVRWGGMDWIDLAQVRDS